MNAVRHIVGLSTSACVTCLVTVDATGSTYEHAKLWDLEFILTSYGSVFDASSQGQRRRCINIQ